jgi:hypothetical protein
MSLFFNSFSAPIRNSLWLTAVLVASAIVPAQAATPAAEISAVQLAQDYVRATSGFDQALLQQILAPDYQEISPVGEVDVRDKVISFYPAAAKAKAPQVTPVLSELTSRVYSEALVISTGKLTYSFAGTPHSRSMRVQFVSALQHNRWQLVSAQFTGIPAAKK